jgi:hypothetical protein
MKIESKTITKIYPHEGYVLTQKREVKDSERIFSNMIILGAGDSAENYKEMGKAEADSIMARLKADAEKKRIEEEKEKERHRLLARLAELDNQNEQ